MSRSMLCISLLILGSPSLSIAERAVYSLGVEGGNPWQVGLSEEPGFYVTYDAEGQPLDAVPVSVAPLAAGTDTVFAGVDTLIDYSGGGMASPWIDPSWNLAAIEEYDPQTGFGQVSRYDIGNIRITSGDGGYVKDHLPNGHLAYDGDPATAAYKNFIQAENSPPGVGFGYRNNMIVNFGADLPINRIRFYPRLSREEDAHIIRAMAEPKPPIEAFGTTSFRKNYLQWYEIGVADNTAPFADNYLAIPRGKRPHKQMAPAGRRGFGATNDPDLKILRTLTNNEDVVVDFRFPLRHERWVAIRSVNPIRSWELAEFEVYGQGYVRKSVYKSSILDFGKPVSWDRIRWAGEMPQGTRIEIRTRTGTDANPENYWRRNSITGQIVPIDFETNRRIGMGRELPAYDMENWSQWSPPYDFRAGLRDPETPAEAWEDGMPLQSPSPSRYLQLHIVFYTASATPRLDGLWLQFADSPAASELVAEIWPIQVDSFEPRNFTYILRPDFQEGDAGFDRVEILTHVEASTVHYVKVDGVEVDLEAFPPEIESDRLIVKLDRKLHDPDRDRLKQVEVNFDVSVLRFGAEFTGWVFDSEDPSRLKQKIEAGNATFRHAGDVLSVRTNIGGDLLLFADPSPNPFSPNGDGVNDRLSIDFTVREVAVQRSTRVQIYDLGGRLVREITREAVTAGAYSREWDGRDDGGELVPPGIYLYRIELQTDNRTDEKVGTVGVAY